MSDRRAVQSVTDTQPINGNPVKSKESIWLTHWMSRNTNASQQARIIKKLDCVAKNNNNPTDGSDVSSIKRFGLIENKAVEIFDEMVKMSSENIGNGKMKSSMFGNGQVTNGVLNKGVDSGRKIPVPFGEGTSKNPPKMVEIRPAERGNGFAVPKERFVEPSSRVVSYKFDLEKHVSNKGMNISFCAKGSFSAAPTMAVNMESNIPQWMNVSSSKQIVPPPSNVKIPDVDLELLGLAGPPMFPPKMILSSRAPQTSKMVPQKMILSSISEIENLQPKVEPPKPNPNVVNLEETPNPDPSDRWIKRLKLNPPNTYTQGAKTDENPSQEKPKQTKLFGAIISSNVTEAEPISCMPPPPIKPHGKDNVKENEAGKFMKDVKKPRDKLFESAWMRRWTRDGSQVQPKKPEPGPNNPWIKKFPPEGHEKKYVPSLKAMAMMSKVFTCPQPFVVQRRGACLVWKPNDASC